MNNIRDARKAKGLTMKVLGQMIGVAESTVSMYENGKREPDNATLIRIANTLDVSVDYLLGQTENSSNDGMIKKQPTAQSDELDNSLVSMLMDLNPQDAQRVRDFVQGLKAARAEQSSQIE